MHCNNRMIRVQWKWKEGTNQVLKALFYLRSQLVKLYSVDSRSIKYNYTALMEWYWPGKTEVPVRLPLCPPQMLHWLGWEWSQTSAVGGKRLTDRATAVPWNEAVLTYFKILLQHFLGSGPTFKTESSTKRRTSTFRSRVSWECIQSGARIYRLTIYDK